jgi:hypothetical protein
VFSAQIFQENTFLKTKPNFPLTGKCFLLTNFSNGKQTQESLKNSFPETIFREINIALENKVIFLISGLPSTEIFFIKIVFILLI